MDFFHDIQTERISILFSNYFDGQCPFCLYKNWKILETWIHSVQDLGGPTRKRWVDVEMKRVQCLNPDCNMIFTPEHPLYPKGYHYSGDVIQFALTQAHRFMTSSIVISAQLSEQHQVTVDPKTVQSWINEKTEAFFQTYFQRHPETAAHDFKAITIDGTWFTKGMDDIGKKKAVHFSSVTKLADGTYLLTWWE